MALATARRGRYQPTEHIGHRRCNERFRVGREIAPSGMGFPFRQVGGVFLEISRW